MSTKRSGRPLLRRLALTTAVVGASLGLALGAACAQTDADAPSDDAMVNLIRLLVKQGTISKDNADLLLKQAKAEASRARKAEHQKSAEASAPAEQAASSGLAQAAPPAPGVVRVPYVSPAVKKQIAEEVKQEVMESARDENWAQPDTLPAWIRNIEWGADFRFRDQSDFYADSNAPSIDFQAFNAGGPIDVNPANAFTTFPFLDTTKDRPTIMSIRARLSMNVHIDDDVLLGLRLATGNENSPVSTTQALGGGFVKKGIWLDRAYLAVTPLSWLSASFGRMPDPFMRTDLVFDDDLNFDGVDLAMNSKEAGRQGLGFSSTLGAFPLEYVPYTFPQHDASKSANRTKYLLAAQVGADWQGKHWDWKVSGAYYDFVHVQGALSSPCAIYQSVVECSSDETRPAFMQKGNMLFLLRNIVPDPSSPLNYRQPQYVGLSFDYDVVDANTSLDFEIGGPYHMTFVGDYARNVAYDKNDAFRYAPLGMPLTNLPANVPAGTKGALQSGPNAWMVKATVGDPLPRQPWEWSFTAGYKYIEPDAVVDGYNDSDFHLGGTNAKGYFIGASLGLFSHTWLEARWMSASQVYGDPLAIDVFQLDLNAGL
jgi:hypothetical protein